MTQIITHRGLNPSKKNYYAESSLEAFKDQAKRGFGLEFDINFTKDDKIIIFHDAGLERITSGKDKRLFHDMTMAKIKKIDLSGDKFCDLNELFEIIRKNEAPVNALHLKGKFQEKKYLNILINYLTKNQDIIPKLIIFDVKIKTAKYLKNKMPNLVLAPSVAHEHDIERYNNAVNGTLMTAKKAIKRKSLFGWVWLDEWDRTDAGGDEKTLYNEKIFSELKEQGFKISLVAPELHATSPSLSGNESHPDAADKDTLIKKVKEIIKLRPDAICTDYPDETKKILLNMQEI